VVAPTVWVFEPESPALALGSTQPQEDVDPIAAAELGVDVLRRRSGGGAVLLEPGACLWIDVVLPARDRRWTEDVSVAPLWLGRVWADAIERIELVTPGGAQVHTGPMLGSPFASVVCFAGTGPGEVLTGGKSVGISQRRTRELARFQSVALLSWDWPMHQRLLAPGLHRVDAVDREPRVSPLVGVGVDVDRLLDAFLSSLGRS
jgi:lipoate-protein ligase A